MPTTRGGSVRVEQVGHLRGVRLITHLIRSILILEIVPRTAFVGRVGIFHFDAAR